MSNQHLLRIFLARPGCVCVQIRSRDYLLRRAFWIYLRDVKLVDINSLPRFLQDNKQLCKKILHFLAVTERLYKNGLLH